jgi:hypothetical protein
MISSLIDKFKGLWYGERISEVEGYCIMSDTTNKKTLLLVKDNEKSWKTKWYNDNHNTYKAPTLPLSTVFNNKT